METPPKLPPVSNSSSVDNSIVPCNAEESIGNRMDIGFHQNERLWSDVNSSQDFGGGMMKIVPSDIDVSISRPMHI